MTAEPTLPGRMREYANAHCLADAHPMVRALTALEMALGNPASNARVLVGCWARARLAWRQETGEPLV